MPIDALFFASARVSTFVGQRGLTSASGFYFQRDERLFLVTSRHVVIEDGSGHFPDRLEVELHLDADSAEPEQGQRRAAFETQ